MKRITAKYVVRLTSCLLMFFKFFSFQTSIHRNICAPSVQALHLFAENQRGGDPWKPGNQAVKKNEIFNNGLMLPTEHCPCCAYRKENCSF